MHHVIIITHLHHMLLIALMSARVLPTTPNDTLPKKLLFGEVTGLHPPGSLGQVSVMLH